MNAFRLKDGGLDRLYLRTCAIYRIARVKKLDKMTVKQLADLPIRKTHKPPAWLYPTIDIWFNYPFKGH